MNNPTDTNQASELKRTLDDILSQAFTDGASDTMWQNDKHVDIFATAKKELQSLIRTEKLKLLDRLEKQATIVTSLSGEKAGTIDLAAIENERNELKEAEL